MPLQPTDDLIDLLLDVSGDEQLLITLTDGLTFIALVEQNDSSFYRGRDRFTLVIPVRVGWNDDLLPFYESISREGLLVADPVSIDEGSSERPSLKVIVQDELSDPIEVERIDHVCPLADYHFGLYPSVTHRQLHQELSILLSSVEAGDRLRIEFEDGTVLFACVLKNDSSGAIEYRPTNALVCVPIEVDTEHSTVACPSPKATITSEAFHLNADADLSSQAVRPFVHWWDVDVNDLEPTGESIEPAPQSIERIDLQDEQ